MSQLKKLEERLERQIKRRDKAIVVVGFASKRIVDMISRTRLLIENEIKQNEHESKI